MSTITLQTTLRTSAPRLAQPIGRAAAALWAALADWVRPHQQTPIEAAAELRRLAAQYGSQPSFAADLRAAADRHEQLYGIQ
jgi:hypothetical protein